MTAHLQPEESSERTDVQGQFLRAQISRVEAEQRKLELEGREIRERLERQWYEGRYVLEVTVGAIAASALVAGWLITYLNPILNRKQELAALDAQVQSKVNERQRIENEERTVILERENKNVRGQLEQVSSINSSLQKQQAEAQLNATQLQDRFIKQEAELKTLAKRYAAASEERAQLTRLANATRQDADRLQLEIERIAAARNATAERAKQIATGITAATLRDTVWEIAAEGREPSLRRTFVLLRGDGFFGYNRMQPSDFIFDGTDTWQVKDQTLILSWSEHYSIETYVFSSPGSQSAEGTISNIPGKTTIKRIQ